MSTFTFIRSAVSAVVVLMCAFTVSANPVLIPGTWVNISPPVAFGTSGVTTNGLALDPNNHSTLYVCVGSFDVSLSGLFKTTDGGSTWRKIPGVDGGARVRVDPKNSNHLYYAVGVRGGVGFYVSNDGGNTWSQPQGYKDLSSQGYFADLYDVATDPTDFNHLLVSFHGAWGWTDSKWNTNSGVIESKDGGNTWIVHEPMSGWGTGHSIAFLYDPASGQGNSQTWLLGTQGPGYWRTTNSGATWTQVNPVGIQHGGGTIYYSVTGVLYASSADNILRSTNNGLSFTAGGPGGGNNCVYGDGKTLYTLKCFSSGPFQVSPETDGITWTNQNSQSFSSGPFEMELDTVNRILYSSNWGAGLWALKLEAFKPLVVLSDSIIAQTFNISETWAPQSRTLTAVNVYRNHGQHMNAAVTVTNKSSWLTVSVNAANLDSQIITNVIDPSSFPKTVQKYYDTVTVHAAGAERVDQKYVVTVWVRDAAGLASFAIQPAGSGTIPSNKSFQFNASAYDQYDLLLSPQPAIGWSATGGTISSAGLFTPSSSTANAIITAATQSGTAAVDTVRVSVQPCANGLSYDYYAHTWLTSVSSMPSGTPTQTGTSLNVSINPTTTSADSFVLKFKGYVMIPVSGSYTFFTTSDDGSALFIDGNRVVDNDGLHAAQERSGSVTLGWGLHTIEVLYFEQTGGQELGMKWQGPGIAKASIPDSMLFHENGATENSQKIGTGMAAPLSTKSMTVKAVNQGIAINAPSANSWELQLFSLDGALAARFHGQGDALIPFTKNNGAFMISRLRSGTTESVSRICIK